MGRDFDANPAKVLLRLPAETFNLMLGCAQRLIDQAETPPGESSSTDDGSARALEIVIAMFLADEKGLFKAHRADIEQGIKTYAMNLILEGLRRKGLVTFEPFTLEDILTMNFERHIEKTELLLKAQESVKKKETTPKR